MRVDELRRGLDEIAGPEPVAGPHARDAVRGRARRARSRRIALAAALSVLVVAASLAAVAAVSRADDEHSVASGSNEVHITSVPSGFSVDVPAGWNANAPAVNRGQILLRASIDYTPPEIGRDCSASRGQRGVSVMIQEFGRQLILSGVVPRPTPFSPTSGFGLERDEGQRCHDLTQAIWFSDHGRQFHVEVSMAGDTTPEREREVYAVLNSLRFASKAWSDFCAVASRIEALRTRPADPSTSPPEVHTPAERLAAASPSPRVAAAITDSLALLESGEWTKATQNADVRRIDRALRAQCHRTIAIFQH